MITVTLGARVCCLGEPGWKWGVKDQVNAFQIRHDSFIHLTIHNLLSMCTYSSFSILFLPHNKSIPLESSHVQNLYKKKWEYYLEYLMALTTFNQWVSLSFLFGTACSLPKQNISPFPPQCMKSFYFCIFWRKYKNKVFLSI